MNVPSLAVAEVAARCLSLSYNLEYAAGAESAGTAGGAGGTSLDHGTWISTTVGTASLSTDLGNGIGLSLSTDLGDLLAFSTPAATPPAIATAPATLPTAMPTSSCQGIFAGADVLAGADVGAAIASGVDEGEGTGTGAGVEGVGANAGEGDGDGGDGAAFDGTSYNLEYAAGAETAGGAGGTSLDHGT